MSGFGEDADDDDDDGGKERNTLGGRLDPEYGDGRRPNSHASEANFSKRIA